MIEGAVMWTSLETAELMALWRRTETQQLFRSSGRNLAIWERLAEELLERGFYRTAHQCRAKLHNMVCLYRKVERGELPRARCRHYETLRGVLGAGSREELERFNAPWEERCRRERLLREQEQSQLSRLPSERRADQPVEEQTPTQTELSSLRSQLRLPQTRLSPTQSQLSATQSRPEQLSPDTAGARSASSPLGSAGRRPPPTLVPLGEQKRPRRRLPELLPLSALPTSADRSESRADDDDRPSQSPSSSDGDYDSDPKLGVTVDLTMKNEDVHSAAKRKAEDFPMAQKLPGSAFIRVIPNSLLLSRLTSIGSEKRELFRPGYEEETRGQRLASALAFMRDNAPNLSVLRTEQDGVPPAPAHQKGMADSVTSIRHDSSCVDDVRVNSRVMGSASVPRCSPAESDDEPLALVTSRPSPSRLTISSPRPRSPTSPHRLIIDSGPESTGSPSPSPAPAGLLPATLPHSVPFSASHDPAVFTGRLQELPVARCGTPPPAHRQSVVSHRHRSRASTSPSPPRAIEAQHSAVGVPTLSELQHRRLLGLRSPPSPLKPRAKSGWPSAGWHPGGAVQSAAAWRRVRQLLTDAAGAQMAAYQFLGNRVRTGHDAV